MEDVLGGGGGIGIADCPLPIAHCRSTAHSNRQSAIGNGSISPARRARIHWGVVSGEMMSSSGVLPPGFLDVGRLLEASRPRPRTAWGWYALVGFGAAVLA